MPAGIARIEVRFLIDANGILNVTARDQRTGKEHSVEVKPSYGLTDEQVENMIRESFEKAEQDFRNGRFAKRVSRRTRFWRQWKRRNRMTPGIELTDEERQNIDLTVNQLLTVLSLRRSSVD